MNKTKINRVMITLGQNSDVGPVVYSEQKTISQLKKELLPQINELLDQHWSNLWRWNNLKKEIFERQTLATKHMFVGDSICNFYEWSCDVCPFYVQNVLGAGCANPNLMALMKKIEDVCRKINAGR